jgi:hypothetical protein
MDVIVDKIDTGLSHLEYALLSKDNYKRTALLIIKDGDQCKEFVFSSLAFECSNTWRAHSELSTAVFDHLRKILKSKISGFLSLRILRPGEAMKHSPEVLTDFTSYQDEFIVDGVRQTFQKANEHVFRDILKNNDTIFVYAYNPDPW